MRGLGHRYIVPMLVAIGPYHHDASDHLKKMEEVKRAVALQLSKRWGTKPAREVYEAVLAVEGRARKLYAADHVPAAMADPGNFAAMMFFDACFLLQYMEASESAEFTKQEDALSKLLFSNRGWIHNDIMLLENQLPWLVVQTVINSLPQDRAKHYIEVVGRFIAQTGSSFNILEVEEREPPFVWDEPPPHLLGLLRQYKTGKERSQRKWPHDVREISAPSAIELAEIGIRLRASETALFTDMDLERGPFCWKLSLAPLSLTDTKACCLVNMAAFEVAAGSSYRDHANRTAVCSYLALFSMFMLQEKDVNELRAKCILHDHHSNEEMLAFFKRIVKHLPDTGARFADIMARIQEYKQRRWIWNRVHKCTYNNYKATLKTVAILGTLAAIFHPLFSLINHSH
ncbi:unnamed protein product [Urochloa humidicola]